VNVDVHVVVDISCTFELGLCGWHGNWSHHLTSSPSSGNDPCLWVIDIVTVLSVWMLRRQFMMII